MLLNNAALLDAIETALIEANDAFKGWPELASAALRAVADAGFVIVPREPTDKMVEAAAKEYARQDARINGGLGADAVSEVLVERHWRLYAKNARAVFEAMLKEAAK